MRVLRLVLAAALAAPAVAAAQPAPGPHRQLYMYQGADREQRILEGAKKEKQVTVYTSLNLKDSVADHPGLREEVRRQGRALALEQREGAAARARPRRAPAAFRSTLSS
jgi:hypothetical protein